MKNTILLAFFAFINFISFGQLDSTTAQINIVAEYTNTSNSSVAYDMAVLTLIMDDVDDLGILNVVVYDETSNNVMLESVYTRQELLDGGYIQINGVEMPLISTELGRSYRVEINPQNLTGANTRMCSLIISN